MQGTIEEADNIAQTFDPILRISQTESGERRKHFSQIDLRKVVLRAAEIYSAVVEDRGGKLIVDAGDTPVLIWRDDRLLLQLIANLIENAIRHNGGKPFLTMLTALLHGSPYVVIADNGPSILESERQKVKERFYRLDKNRSTKGSGLGLSLVKAIADLHEATLKLGDNHPGCGHRSRFHDLRTLSSPSPAKC